MKLLILLTTVACLQATAKGFGQSLSLSLSNAPLEQAFKEIKKQTGYSFVYTRDQLKNTSPVNCQIKNAELKEVLDICFRNQPLSFVIEDHYIVVQTKVEIASSQTTQSLPIEVRGRVVNENGEGVIATISEKGKKNSVSTDSEGYFLMKNVDKEAILVITGINIESYEIKVNNRTDLAVIYIKSKVIEGEEVKLLSTGYQVIAKERATGSFAIVNKEQFDNRVSTDVISRLDGISSGLLFNKQALLGTPELSIRGRSTIFANDQPLIVVDNFPYDGDINNINPNDVESITVLKDAAAASIWGVRAGNGVIVIITKRGRFNQPLTIQLNTNITIGNKPDLFYNPNFLNSSDFIDVEKYLFSNGYYDADAISTRQVPISQVVEILLKQRSGIISATDASAQINALKSNDVRNDISKYLYRNSVNQQHAINISGGTDKANYLLSVGYDKDLSNKIQTDYDRITLNSSNTFAPFRNFEIQAGINYIQNSQDNNLGGTGISTGGPNSRDIYPYAQLADAQGNPLSIVKNYRSSFLQAAQANGFLNWQYVPLNDIGLHTSKTSMQDARINAGARYNFISGLSGEIKYQYEKFVVKTRDLAQLQSYDTRNMINSFATVSPSGIVTKLDNVPIGGILGLSNTTQISNNLRGQINFDHVWNKHRVNVIAGVEAREIIAESNTSRLYGYDDQYGTYKTVVNPTTNYTLYPSGSSGGTISDGLGVTGGINRFRDYFTNAAYTYKDRYTFSASGRIDQSNFFGVKTNQRSVPLWSMGGKWDINKETFYHVDWLPQLALRVTYGYNGNLDNTVTAITTFRYLTNAQLTGAPYASVNNIGNPQLRWEKTGMLNIGIDFGNLKNVFSGSIEYYKKKGKDLMGDEPLPASSGTTQLRGNFADMAGRGIDLQLISKNINKTFKWVTNFLFSYAIDKVTKYDISFPASYYLVVSSNSIKYPLVGKPVYSVFSLRWGGLDPATGDPRGFTGDTLSKIYTALNNPSPSDIIYNGPARPTFFGNLLNSFSYKGFTASINIVYKLGYYFRRTSVSYDLLYVGWKGNKDYSLRWQKPGDEINTNVPSIVYPSNPQRDLFYSNSEILVEKGDHVRLQYISLSYDFEKSGWKKLPLKHLKLYTIISNLGIIWRANKSHLDPDYPSPYGYAATSAPSPRTISIGLRTDF